MDNICRTCMRTCKKLIDLKSDEALLEKILLLSSIQITLDDDFPKAICNECEDNLNKFFCFRKVVINTDKELKERMNNFIKINHVKEENICKSEDIFFDEHDNDQNDDTFDEEEDCIDDDITPEKHKDKLKYSKTCSECNITFLTSTELWKHKRKHHVKPGICNICGVIVRADNLKKHVRIHYQETVPCKICNKKYKNAESLRSHLLIHKGLEFKCDICGKVSTVKSEHHRHVKSHEDPNIRKVICTICGKRMKDLKRHMLSHTGERPHPCKFCEKCFTSSYALKVHTRQHTNEKPFICEYCSMGFKQKCSLITHLKSKHDNQNK